MDFTKNISKIEKIIAYKFKDKSLLTQAFTRSSFCNENRTATDRYYSNEVLEFFGDSVLSTAIISIFLESKTERSAHGIATELGEGDFSVLRSKLSDKRNLSLATEKLGIHKYLIMGEGDVKLGIENEPSVMEDLFESIVGAIYVDCGMNMETVISSVKVMLDLSHYSQSVPSASPSAKNALQEWCADKSRRLPPPRYETVSEDGPDHKKIYERACYIGDRLCGTGKGKNCKIADTLAAEAALNTLRREETEAKKPRISPDEILPTLSTLARKNKVASAQFKDLGESEESTTYSPEFIIECRFMGKSGIGKGKSKLEARAAAAHEVLVLLGERKPATPEKPTKAKKVKKEKVTKKAEGTKKAESTAEDTNLAMAEAPDSEQSKNEVENSKNKKKALPRVKKSAKKPKNTAKLDIPTSQADGNAEAAKSEKVGKPTAALDTPTESLKATENTNKSSAPGGKSKKHKKAAKPDTPSARADAEPKAPKIAAKKDTHPPHVRKAESPKNATRPPVFRKNKRKPAKAK